MDRFDQMTTFVRVAELGGSAAAARDLGAAPSAVTTHIQALERRLGARLLNRNTRHVKPTEVGEATTGTAWMFSIAWNRRRIWWNRAWRITSEYVSVGS